MADITTAGIGQLFDLLDEHRHLPKYNLELRASPFFELFLPDVLKECGMPVKTPIVPEFPLKKKRNNQSRNVDFFALSENGEHAFLIELKTDMASLSSDQNTYLMEATRKKLHELINDIKQIAGRSRYYRKYVYLLHLLSELQLISSIKEAEDIAFEKSPRGVREAISNVKVTAPESFPKVVCIWPRIENTKLQGSPAYRTITFDQVSKVVARHGPVGEVFAKYLTKWEEDPANNFPRSATP